MAEIWQISLDMMDLPERRLESLANEDNLVGCVPYRHLLSSKLPAVYRFPSLPNRISEYLNNHEFKSFRNSKLLI
jgi:hypothetical protein